ncbi:MAG TPA: adenylate/guanylate cyclase domain-containing protein, partial [Leptospiraceae bacterium]|nr:adenylate/guanylate cyclase domain-containing protein [Leptospiraceae bacterium]
DRETKDAVAICNQKMIDRPALHWKQITVPGIIERQTNFRGSTFWYRRLFRLSGAPEASVAVRLGRINDRDQTYLNGVLIGATGEWDSTIPAGYDRTRIYGIPDNLLNRRGCNVLLIHVKRYFAESSGIATGVTVIGPASSITHEYFLEMIRTSWMLGAYPALGLLFLIIYAVRRKQTEYLYFGLFTILLTLYELFRFDVKFELGISFFATKRIEYVLLYCLFPIFTAFLDTYFDAASLFRTRSIRRVILAANLYLICFILPTLLSNDVDFWWTLQSHFIQPVWPVLFGYCLLILALQSMRGRKDALLLVPATLLLMAAVVLDILHAWNVVIHLPPLTIYAFSIFILSIAFLLAQRFAQSFSAVETTMSNLNATNAAYSRFVPAEFLQILGKREITEVALGDQTLREMTILFSDIRSFTVMSEAMTPEENFNFLNSYLKRMQPHVQMNGGFIDKYIGDAIMALFPRHPGEALDSAIAMQHEMIRFNQDRVAKGFQEIRAGIGIHCGHLMLGTIGAADRMEGTVISDAVNLAARMEGLTKFYGAGILITEHVMMRLPDPTRYLLRTLERVRVKGKSSAVSVIEVLDGYANCELYSASRPEFDRGMHSYLNREFKDAADSFHAVLDQNPGDGASKILLNRAIEHQNRGVGADWEGIIDMDAK